MHQKQFSPEGFEWIDHGDHENSVMSYLRKGINEKDNIISKDEHHDHGDEIQKLTDDFIKKIDVSSKTKEEEILTI